MSASHGSPVSESGINGGESCAACVALDRFIETALFCGYASKAPEPQLRAALSAIVHVVPRSLADMTALTAAMERDPSGPFTPGGKPC